MSQADSIDNTDDIEVYNLPEYFCEGLAKIEQVGPCRRLVFVIHQTINGRRSRLGVAKLVLPADALPEIVQKLVADIHGPRALESYPVPASALAN
jgi:hypothetical protein